MSKAFARRSSASVASFTVTVFMLTLAVQTALAGEKPTSQASPVTTRPGNPPIVDELLEGTELIKSEALLTRALAAQPRDDSVRFRLGIVRTLRAVEQLGQTLHRHTSRDSHLPWTQWVWGSVVPLALPDNSNPAPLSHDGFRQILLAWLDDLATAEATLAKITDPNVAVRVRIWQIRLDVNGDGVASPDETLIRLQPLPYNVQRDETYFQYTVRFDRGDVAWLRSYCHLLMAATEFILAHNTADTFDHLANLVFPAAQTSYPLVEPGHGAYDGYVDLIAMAHVIRWPVQEPRRMRAALEHLESAVRLNREMWVFVEAETDNDREWIPNARQVSALPAGHLSAAQIKAWRAMLDEAAEILAGRKLVPLWRGAKPRGINIRRVFTEPREFDLVLWVQGAAALPYVEDGPLTTRETWEALTDAFRGDLLGFALWLN